MKSATGDQGAKSIGKTCVLAILKQKNDFLWGHTVKTVQNHCERIGFILFVFFFRVPAIPGRLTDLATSRFVCVCVPTL